MEPITRKRKLNEIDKNKPFFPNSISSTSGTQDNGGKCNLKLHKHHFLATQSDGCENNVHSLSKDVKDLENSQFQSGNRRTKDKAIKSEGRNHMKSCDRRYRKTISQDENVDGKKVDPPLDTTQPKQLELSDLSQYNISCGVESLIHETNLHLVNELEAREMRMWFNYEYFEDILAYELQKERQYKLSLDFCKKYDIDPTRREILIDWLVSVQIHLKANNNTLHLAVSLLDVLLDRIYVPYKLLQVSAIAAFWVAYKFIHGNLSVKTLISLCAGIPTRDMILDHEILVLESSRLLQTGGDMSTFFNYLLYKLFGHSYPPEIYYSGQYFLEIMLTQFVFIDCSSSEKAITAVYAALTIFDSALRFKLFEFTNFITKKKLKIKCCHLMRLLKLMYSDEEMLKNSCLFRKYKSSSNYNDWMETQMMKLSLMEVKEITFEKNDTPPLTNVQDLECLLTNERSNPFSFLLTVLITPCPQIAVAESCEWLESIDGYAF